MKKLVALLLLCAMLVLAFAGCAQKKKDKDDEKNNGQQQTGFEDFKIPAGMSGADIAKLLLANERLNATLLKTEGDIFENGAEVYRSLAIKAEQNLAASAQQLAATPMLYRTLTPVALSEVVDDGKGRVEIDGNVYRWSDFKEYNNSFDAFSSTTKGIVDSAKEAADMIDNIKKNVRVVDKWVDMGDTSFFLHVDENSELLLQKMSIEEETRLTVCMRYKNEQGEDVYQLFSEGDIPGQYVFSTRTTYIPGKRYEFSTRQDFGYDVHENCFVADNSKGYWETYTVGVAPEHYNVSYFIMKDDIAYDSFYDPKTKKINYLKVMSADKATDILNIMGDVSDGIVFVDLIFSGFDGVENIEIEARPDEIVTDLEWYYNLPREEKTGYKLFVKDGTYSLIDQNSAVINLTNGKELRMGDKFADGKVEVSAIRGELSTGNFALGAVGLTMNVTSNEELVQMISALVDELGLTCRRDTDTTLAAISRAYEELIPITAYYKWNGIVVSDEEAITQAYAIERSRFAEMKARADIAKDAEVIDYNDKELLALNVSFSDVELLAATGISTANAVITIENVSLSVKDTLLFVEDEPYSVSFALIPAGGSGLVHLGSSAESLAFTGGEFTVQGGATLEIPHLVAGDYNLVAYVATSDGIRSTKYVKLSAESADGTTVKYHNMNMTTGLDSDGSLIISFRENVDVYTEIMASATLGYEELYELVNENICEYGVPVNAVIEIADDDEYAAMSGEETELSEGEYRVKYERENASGSGRVEGYFYFTLTLESAEVISE